jgi:hypothetical protein
MLRVFSKTKGDGESCPLFFAMDFSDIYDAGMLEKE